MKRAQKPELTERTILGILEKHSDALKKLSVKKIGLFGSYVRGEQKKRSDIDFLVEFRAADF